ncbi:hypothetical protein C8R45DRAFT_1101820 [Mycena sanguinolenta]|nr:hypothetical protein C8R45DRAFT_1101820 [Mycena sanguinolenta]
MTYTIPHASFQEMGLSSDIDYKTLITEAIKKPVPLTIKIAMAQLPSGEDDPSASEDKGARPKKKKKVYEPTEEEEEQVEIIAKLNAEWKCEAWPCKQFCCFPDRENAKYIHLTHLHLQTWACAIQGKIVNADTTAVDSRNPPDSKMFSHQDLDQEDNTLLHNRQKAANKESNIVINLTVPDPKPAAAPAVPSHAAPVHSHLPIAPQMSLELFCLRFSLTADIHDKLAAYSVTSPQILRYLKNSHLEEAFRNPAQVADIRDAQDRWILGEGE